MSIIATARIFLERFTPESSIEVEKILQRNADFYSPSRKGRHWEGAFRTNRGFTLHDYRTEKVLYDCAQDLEELGLTTNDLPDCVLIATAQGGPEDLQFCESLVSAISKNLNGHTLGAVLGS